MPGPHRLWVLKVDAVYLKMQKDVRSTKSLGCVQGCRGNYWCGEAGRPAETMLKHFRECSQLNVEYPVKLAPQQTTGHLSSFLAPLSQGREYGYLLISDLHVFNCVLL